jgi:glutamyl-tRNA synthetase
MTGSGSSPATSPVLQPAVGRLAPSPTGALHLGNARSFLLAWLSIRQQRGKLWLRIEDIDSPRVKAWALRATIDDLRWLGLDWDAGPEDELQAPTRAEQLSSQAATPDGPTPPQPIEAIQTRRLARYRQVLEQLIADGCLYPCTCSRSEVAQAASAPHESSLASLEGPVYPGTCRPSIPSGSVQARSRDTTITIDKFAWRWHFRSGDLVWRDQLRGCMRANPAEQLGDFVIARGDGTPAYQLAVVVDDHDMQVTEVIRGDDLIFSTYRQLAILEHLGWSTPRYFHVPLMLGPDGRRLAKRHGDTRLSTFREQGVAAERVVGYLAWTLGMQATPEPLRASDLIGQLDWSALPRKPTVVDYDLLPW